MLKFTNYFTGFFWVKPKSLFFCITRCNNSLNFAL